MEHENLFIVEEMLNSLDTNGFIESNVKNGEVDKYIKARLVVDRFSNN